MKKIISVLLIFAVLFSTTVVFAENNKLEKGFVSADLLFDTMPECDISLMSAGKDDFEDVITSGWDNLEYEIDVSEFKIHKSDIDKLYHRILFSNPRYYYVLTYCGYSYSLSTGFLKKIEPFYGTEDKEEIENTLNEIDEACEDVLFLISENMSDFDKVMTVHDYMVEHFSYDHDFYNDVMEGNIDEEAYHHQYTLEIMTKKMGVCQGYTLAFTYIMDKIGIETRFVSSDEMNHAWNLVKVDGDWYHIDVTWDDTDNCEDVNHIYELVSTDCIQALPRPHYGFDLGDLEADSTRFDDAPWHESTAEVAYCHGKSYWIEGDNLVDEDGNIIYENLAGADEKWDFEGIGSIDGMVFSGLAEYNGKLYFNTDKAIYTYDPHTMITSKMMDKPLVGGLYIDKNILFYAGAVVEKDDEGTYITFEEAGTIVLEHARFAEPYIKENKIVARIYKECDDDIVVFAKTSKGTETKHVTQQGYSSMEFEADDEAEIFYWTSNLKPLRDKEEIIIR